MGPAARWRVENLPHAVQQCKRRVENCPIERKPGPSKDRGFARGLLAAGGGLGRGGGGGSGGGGGGGGFAGRFAGELLPACVGLDGLGRVITLSHLGRVSPSQPLWKRKSRPSLTMKLSGSIWILSPSIMAHEHQPPWAGSYLAGLFLKRSRLVCEAKR